MRHDWLVIGGVCLALLLGTVPLVAHHAFASQYDINKPIKFTGKVTRVEWTNPHIYVYVDVTNDGKTINYAVEGPPPNGLLRQGWKRDTMKIGEAISIEGSLAKDGSNTVSARSFTLADGRKLGADGNQSSATP